MLFSILTIALGSICIVSTSLSLIKSEVWWIRIFDFPRMQILVLGILSIGLSIYIEEWNGFLIGFVIILSATILFQTVRIYPYTTLHKHQVLKNKEKSPDWEIGVLITNIYMENRSCEQCFQEIKKADPDVILAVETNKWWESQLNTLEKKYLFTIKIPLENTYGMLLYSRLKLTDSQINYLVENDVPSIKTKIELKSGKKILFYGIHPKPPAPNENNSSLPRDAELILVAKDSKNEKSPVIVAGDLNDVAWSHTTHLFQKISGLLDPRVGRGMFSTYNSKYPLFRWPLDHLFHSPDFQIRSKE
ncbi:MAG TPA: endonuclease/exonuclease/phosphatase family protein [Cytophagales bacterium]|nr:endonuclease/exonuclease/phosphatase family protein [Cytophagales bacterium]